MFCVGENGRFVARSLCGPPRHAARSAVSDGRSGCNRFKGSVRKQQFRSSRRAVQRLVVATTTTAKASRHRRGRFSGAHWQSGARCACSVKAAAGPWRQRYHKPCGGAKNCGRKHVMTPIAMRASSRGRSASYSKCRSDFRRRGLLVCHPHETIRRSVASR